MSNLSTVIDQIKTTRQYVLQILGGVDESLWFRMPTEGVTHVAWQVGHMTVAQYRLGIVRLRPAVPEDARLFSVDMVNMMKLFGQGSTPVPDPAAYPPIEEIRRAFHASFEQMMTELPSYSEAQLEEPVLIAHPLFTKKIDSLWSCSRHEAMHAGQIALLKRLLGLPPRL